MSLINKIYNYKLCFYILIIKLIFIVSYCFIIEKTAIKYSSIKVSLSLNKAYTFIILSAIKSSIKFITSLLIYYNLFIFNVIIKNEKTMLKYYKKKIIISLLKVIYSLTLNTCKIIIIDLKSNL